MARCVINWDTLLDRAAFRSVQHSYGVVQSVDEIPLRASPRIVKLPGSLLAQLPLI